VYGSGSSVWQQVCTRANARVAPTLAAAGEGRVCVHDAYHLRPASDIRNWCVCVLYGRTQQPWAGVLWKFCSIPITSQAPRGASVGYRQVSYLKWAVPSSPVRLADHKPRPDA
jgi:hypothetical protein